MTINSLLLWFAETSLAVSALILVVLLIRKHFARAFGARAAYALWLAPAARLVLPQLNILPAPETVFVTSPETIFYSASVAGAYPAPVGINWVDVLAATATFIWIAVAFAWFCLKLEEQSRFSKLLLAASHPAPETLRQLAETVSRSIGLRRNIRLRICKENYGPCVIGFWRPVVYLPADFERDYSASEQRLAIAHEFAHVARGDLIATVAAFALQAIQWPNPLVHFAFRAFRVDQEAACDAYVMARNGHRGAAGDYASAILKSSNGDASAPAYGLSLAHPIKERLMLLKNSNNDVWRSVAGSVSAIALIASGLALTASYGYAADEEVIKEKKVEVKKERKVIVVNGDEDFDFETIGEGGDFEFITEGDGKHKIVRVMADGDHEGHRFEFKGSGCTADEGEPEPVKLEWSDEVEGPDGKKEKYQSIICLTGDDAKPENREAALKKVIDKMEADAKAQQARNERMIAGLRKQLKNIDKK